MKVWLVKLEEPVPLENDSRPYRMSMLAEALLKQGHEVVRWCSDFDHLEMRSRFGKFTEYQKSERYTINFVPASVEYTKPVSIQRVVNNFQVLRNFVKLATDANKPDVIVCSMPTPSMAQKCAALSKKFDIPLVLDARDMWPDVIQDELKGWKAIAAWPLVQKMKVDLKRASKQATSCVGITDFFVDFLIRYADRERTSLDLPFALGYKESQIENESDSIEYWSNKGIELPSNSKIVYFAGRLNSTVFNALQPIIDAAAHMEQRALPFKFVVCGSGQYQSRIEGMVSGLKNVVLPGEVDPKHLATLRKHSFVAMQPIENREDYLNSLSNKFFEYISSGLPILSYLGGLTKSTIEQHNCGFHYADGFQMAEHLEKLHNNLELHQELSENARSLFMDSFESSKVYGKFSNHLENVVGAQ